MITGSMSSEDAASALGVPTFAKATVGPPKLEKKYRERRPEPHAR
jgi:hypothetical protein